MKATISTICLLITMTLGACAQQKALPASFVDYDAYEKLVTEVKAHRASRLLPLDQFLQKAKEPKTIILDTRSKEMYDLKHVKGAIHLDFSDFTQQALDLIMAQYGGPETQILIYCNNNFRDKLKPMEIDLAFVTKVARPAIPAKIAVQSRKPLTLALNIPTYINLYGYGYRNVYELSELVDVYDARIEFEGSFTRELAESMRRRLGVRVVKEEVAPK